MTKTWEVWKATINERRALFERTHEPIEIILKEKEKKQMKSNEWGYELITFLKEHEMYDNCKELAINTREELEEMKRKALDQAQNEEQESILLLLFGVIAAMKEIAEGKKKGMAEQW